MEEAAVTGVFAVSQTLLVHERVQAQRDEVVEVVSGRRAGDASKPHPLRHCDVVVLGRVATPSAEQCWLGLILEEGLLRRRQGS